MSSAEAAIVRSLKRHLMARGLDGLPVAGILVDADPAYVHGSAARDLEPIARVPIAGSCPDLLCRSGDGNGTLVSAFAVEVSARDWRRGLGQAERYRAGAHYAYLAVSGKTDEIVREAGPAVRDAGVGLWVLDGGWTQLVAPQQPQPLPRTVAITREAIVGVMVARRLQLNHPLNYLVVALLASQSGESADLNQLLAGHWSDLGTDGTRRHAIEGAIALGLIDTNRQPTLEGATTADLLLALGFDPENRPTKRRRLSEVAPGLGAVARFVFMRQPAVQLIRRALERLDGEALLPELACTAIEFDRSLGSALFLSDPSAQVSEQLPGAGWNSSTVFKLKQNLWHSGLLESGAHASAGGRSDDFRPLEDRWSMTVVKSRLAGS